MIIKAALSKKLSKVCIINKMWLCTERERESKACRRRMRYGSASKLASQKRFHLG